MDTTHCSGTLHGFLLNKHCLALSVHPPPLPPLRVPSPIMAEWNFGGFIPCQGLIPYRRLATSEVVLI